jgi:hypothetical protein
MIRIYQATVDEAWRLPQGARDESTWESRPLYIDEPLVFWLVVVALFVCLPTTLRSGGRRAGSAARAHGLRPIAPALGELVRASGIAAEAAASADCRCTVRYRRV